MAVVDNTEKFRTAFKTAQDKDPRTERDLLSCVRGYRLYWVNTPVCDVVGGDSLRMKYSALMIVTIERYEAGHMHISCWKTGVARGFQGRTYATQVSSAEVSMPNTDKWRPKFKQKGALRQNVCL